MLQVLELPYQGGGGGAIPPRLPPPLPTAPCADLCPLLWHAQVLMAETAEQMVAAMAALRASMQDPVVAIDLGGSPLAHGQGAVLLCFCILMESSCRCQSCCCAVLLTVLTATNAPTKGMRRCTKFPSQGGHM